MKQVFLLSVDKKLRATGISYHGFTHHVGDSKEALIDFIKRKYNVELLKDPDDDFPYFTDGGFKYSAFSPEWEYSFTCHIKELHTQNPITHARKNRQDSY